jgi:hypothetical protein
VHAQVHAVVGQGGVALGLVDGPDRVLADGDTQLGLPGALAAGVVLLQRVVAAAQRAGDPSGDAGIPGGLTDVVDTDLRAHPVEDRVHRFGHRVLDRDPCGALTVGVVHQLAVDGLVVAAVIDGVQAGGPPIVLQRGGEDVGA